MAKHEQEVGVASGSGWNLWVWLLGVVVRRYIHFLILLIPTPLVSVLFAEASLLFVHFVIYKYFDHLGEGRGEMEGREGRKEGRRKR